MSNPEQSEAFRRARRAVSGYAANLGHSALSPESDEGNDAIARKRLEYRLLIGPISRGLSAYLDLAQNDTDNSPMSGSELLTTVGLRVARAVLGELQSDPNLPLVSRLGKARAAELPAEVAEVVYPLGKTIITAAESSANAMYDSAAANALTVAAAVGDSIGRGEFLKAVKQSVRLPLARTFAALSWQQALDEAIYRQAMDKVSGNSLDTQEAILTYDPIRKEVRLTKPIEDWLDHLNLSGQGEGSHIADIAPIDEHIGCPVSFSPKLVVRYYGHMVDMMERHQSWPIFNINK